MSGFVVWFTGLPAAGKTTIATGVAAELGGRGLVVDQLDGDAVRTHLSQGLGYSKEDRDTNIARIAWVASRIARAGAAVLVSAISPYEDARRRARRQVLEHVPFVEVYVATPLGECMRRDPKHLYERALAGEIEEMTGLTAPYESPSTPELALDTTDVAPAESVAATLACLEALDLVPPATPRSS
jgi:adenylyl-sulfate kinase